MDNQFNHSQESTDPYQTNSTYSNQTSSTDPYPTSSTYSNQTSSTDPYPTSSTDPYQTNSTYSQPQYNTQFNPAPVKKPLDVYALISMICGIVSILLCCCCYIVSLICAIAAIVLAIISKNKSETQQFPGMALAGLICGIIGLSFGIIVLIFVVVGNTSNFFDYIVDYIDEL